MKRIILRVLPNPWHQLDGNGMPACAVRVDPDVGRPGAIEYIGATIAISAATENLPNGLTEKENLARQPQFRRRARAYDWATTPVEIVATPVHIGYVRTGVIIAADKETARECKTWFTEPTKALAMAREAAIKQYKAETGHDPPTDQWFDAPRQPNVVAVIEPETVELAAPFGIPEEEVARLAMTKDVVPCATCGAIEACSHERAGKALPPGSPPRIGIDGKVRETVTAKLGARPDKVA